MRQKRIGICRLDQLCCAPPRCIHIALARELHRSRLLGQLECLLRKTCAALRGRRTFIPCDAQFLACLVGRPPAVGDDRHAFHQPVLRVRTVGIGARRANDEDIAHARLLFDVLQIRAKHFAAEYGTFLEHGVLHPRHGHIDTEERLAFENACAIDAGDRRTDDFVVLGILELECLRIGRLDACSASRKFTVGRCPPARLMTHCACLRFAFRNRDIPGFRRRRHQHVSTGGSNSSQWIPA